MLTYKCNLKTNLGTMSETVFIALKIDRIKDTKIIIYLWPKVMLNAFGAKDFMEI